MKALSRLLAKLRGWKRRSRPNALGIGELKAMIRGILSTREDEIACGDCYRQLDRFAELVLDGKDAAAAAPLVQDHLNRCRDCREEFEALLSALKALQ